MPSKTAAQAAAKWKNRTGVAVEDYKLGIQNPRYDWETATAAAEDNYKQGISDSITKGRFGKGVRAAGSAKQKANALSKGADRYPSGVAASTDDYAKAMAPVLSAIDSTSLPKRYAKGDPRNLDRVKAIAMALHKLKVG